MKEDMLEKTGIVIKEVNSLRQTVKDYAGLAEKGLNEAMKKKDIETVKALMIYFDTVIARLQKISRNEDVDRLTNVYNKAIDMISETEKGKKK